MALPTNTRAGGAVPIIAVSDTPQAHTALPCYRYTVQPTDGRPVLGGPALRVKVLQASDLKQNGGTYILSGAAYALPVFVEAAPYPVQGNEPIAVYYIN